MSSESQSNKKRRADEMNNVSSTLSSTTKFISLGSLLSSEAKDICGDALRLFDARLKLARDFAALDNRGDNELVRQQHEDRLLDELMTGDHLSSNVGIDDVRRFRNCVWALRVLHRRVINTPQSTNIENFSYFCISKIILFFDY